MISLKKTETTNLNLHDVTTLAGKTRKTGAIEEAIIQYSRRAAAADSDYNCTDSMRCVRASYIRGESFSETDLHDAARDIFEHECAPQTMTPAIDFIWKGLVVYLAKE